jgi:hypothetical protein
MVESVEREAAGDREPEMALGALVDDVDRHFVRAGVPEERDLEAVLVPIGELFEGYVQLRRSFLVDGLRLTRRSCDRAPPDRARDNPTPAPDLPLID